MKILPFCLQLCLVPALQASPGQAQPGEFLTGPYGPNGTWNLYRISDNPLTWEKAQALAVETTDPHGGTGKPGHLVTISSGAENMFVYSHIVGEAVWIGLTDAAKMAPGATEAGSSPDKGWAWVTGEPFTWSNWQTDEPDNGAARRVESENFVAIQRFGWWGDLSAHYNGRNTENAFVIEWDVQSDKPVKGARVIEKILPDKWPATKTLPAAPPDSPWLTRQVHVSGEGQWGRLDELTAELHGHWDTATPVWMPSINCRLRETITGNGFGWLFQDREFPGAKTSGFGMLCQAKLRVARAGTYTFNVHADDGYAIRIGTHKWKAAHGQGGIDPLDPGVLYFMLFSPDGDTRGVIDLPAGDIPIEVFYFNVGLDGALQIMTAPGVHPLDGSTDQWRLLGHKASGKISWPGMDKDGWKITLAEPDPVRGQTLPGAMESYAHGKSTSGEEVINFHDPEAAGQGKFPGAKPFPEDGPGPQDNRLLVAEGTLVIPEDGTWHIGTRADDACALQIEGKNWIRTVKDVSGSTAKVNADTITLDGRGNMPGDHELIGEIKLTKGTYTLRVLSHDRRGPSIFQVFGAPAGSPPRLLKKRGAATEDDLPGLEVLPFPPL